MAIDLSESLVNETEIIPLSLKAQMKSPKSMQIDFGLNYIWCVIVKIPL